MAIVNMKNFATNKSFGLLFSSIFSILTIYCLFNKSHVLIISSLFLISSVSILITFLMPRLLTPLHKAWLKLGNTLGHVMHPLILGCMFYLIITPMGVLMRICGRDELRLNRRNTSTYWINREPLGHLPNSFNNQY